MDRFSRDSIGAGASRAQAGIQTFMANVYGWMTAGLFVTGVVSYFVANSDELMWLLITSLGGYGIFALFGVELLLVYVISGRINSISSGMATLLFLIYSTVSGITLAPIFFVYTYESIASVFLITAGTFGIMTAYGYLTKADLSSWGNILFMGLIGLIVATLVNSFWLQNSGLAMILPYAGVLIFVGLTAYDSNKLRRLGEQLEGDEELIRRYSIVGALSLYLDFINLFLYLLRILGNRR